MLNFDPFYYPYASRRNAVFAQRGMVATAVAGADQHATVWPLAGDRAGGAGGRGRAVGAFW